MLGNNLTLAIKIAADARQMRTELRDAGGAFGRFSGGVRSEASAIRGAFRGLAGIAAQLGVSFAALSASVRSAEMDKDLTRIRQSARGTRKQVEGLRGSLFSLSGKTGQSVETLQGAFEALTQSGLSWVESNRTLPAINDALAVTGANVRALTSGLTVGAKTFGIDLTRVGAAADLLDKFTTAGRLANAEIEDLSDIFSRVGVNAKRAGLDLESTLALVESFSKVEKQPERLATLVDSTLRLFTNSKVAGTVSKKTGVKFFDAKGTRRDAIDVLEDISKRYQKLKTDLQREKFLEAILPQADLDTKKGFALLLGKGNIPEIREFSRQIKNATGTIKKDLPDALNNVIAQGGRLKGILGAAGDAFARPVNDAVTKILKFALDAKK
ncbi:MAG: phage tail tape measure protein [Gammaproteobacteria bacterium]